MSDNSDVKVDFVLLWVDGADPEWIKEKEIYSPKKANYSNKSNRFRDWDNLQYWFRGVEKYAPWVNKIYFITWGHVPSWLNLEHPKVVVVNHKDYIPAEYLPTFNSNTIELNLHRIKELSEYFVLFNDDMFIIDKVKLKDFFKDGKPRDEMIFNAIVPKGEKYRINYTNLNNIGIVNEHFRKKAIIKKMPFKIFNLKYGKELIRTILTLPWDGITGIKNPHVGTSHLKSTFDNLWGLEEEKLDATCRNRFRGLNDLNHWLMRYWNLCNGNFVPRKHSFAHYYNISDNNEKIYKCIQKQKYKMICINDMSEDIDFNRIKEELRGAFDKIYKEKSSFEV